MIQTIPGASCGCYRGSIVDRSTRKESKTFVGEMEPRTQSWKDKSCQDIEEKDNRNGLGYFFFLGVNNRSSRCNGRTATDRRAYPNQGSQLCIKVKKALENQMITLKENFENQGVKVESVEITVQTNAFENNQNFNNQNEQKNNTSKNRAKLNLNGLNFDDDNDDELDDEHNSMLNENSSVEYMA